LSNLIWTPPNYLAWSVFKSPEMSTLVQKAVSGKTTRAQLYATPIWNYKLKWELLRNSGSASPTSLNSLIDFFLSRGGAYDSFLYADPDDNAVTDQLIGYGDGVTTQFQLLYQKAGAAAQAAGGFYELVQNPNVVSAVKINGSAQAAFSYAIGTENQLLYSQDFSNAFWSKNALAITANSTAAPDGTTTADTLASSGDGYATQLVTGIAAGELVTFSVYLKAVSGTPTIKIFLNSAFAGGWLTGPFTSCALNSTWQRFSVTAPMSALPGISGMMAMVGGANSIPNGVSVYAWGAQLERFPAASGYLATITDQVKPLGMITFGTAPGLNLPVTASFSFYYRLRFKNDLNEFEQFMKNLWQLQQLELVSETL